jgi:RHS repeat-associated protein
MYRVTVPRYSGDTGAYSFRLLDADHAQPITLNQATNVQLAAYQSAVFTLAGQAGQRFHFASNSVTGDTFVTGWGLYDANFHGIAGADLSQDFGATLPATGTYVLVLSAYSSANNVGFTVAPIADTPVPATGFGAVQSGTVAAGQTATFPYQAPAGLPIAFDWLGSDFSALSLTFNGPGGFRVFSGSFDQGPFLLPASGADTLTLQNFGTTDSPFTFRLLDLTTVPALALGTAVQGTLNPNSARDIYRFNGTLGQRLFFDALTAPPDGFSYQLLTPDGRTISLAAPSSGVPVSPITLTAAGTYYLTASDSQPQAPTIDYSFMLSDLATAAPALPLGQPVSGQLSPGTAVNLYTINGNAGEALAFHSLSVSPSGTGAATWTLYGPDGAPVVSQFSSTYDVGTDFSATLPADGPYALIIAGTSTTGPVSYNVEVASASGGSLFPAIVLRTGRTGSAQFTYDPKFNKLTDAIDELGRETRYAIDPNSGNILSQTLVDPSGGGDAVTQYTYTPHGLLASVTDPLGRKTTYTYDALDRLTAVTQGADTPLAATTRREYDAAGNVTATVDADGHRTEITYDALGRVLSVKGPDGGVTSYSHDAAGNVTSVTDPLGHKTTYAYDTRNHPLTVTDPAGNATTYRYDAGGRSTAVSDPLHDQTQRQYDARGRVISTTDPAGAVTHFAYDVADHLTAITDPLGNTTQIAYDSRGRRISETDPAGAVTRYEYDDANELTAVVDPGGNRTTYTYDAFGRLITETDPLGHVTTYTYDAVGQLIARIDRDGRQTQFAYDALGRLTQETWVGGGNVIHYTYDAAGNLLSAIDNFSALVYTYDALNRPTSVDNTGTPGAPPVVLTYTYDAAGNVTQVADAINGQAAGLTSYSYNALDQMTRITQSGTGVAPKRVDLTYDPTGRFATIERYSDLGGTQLVATSTYAYGAPGRLTSLTHTSAAGATLDYENITYDAAGRISSSTDGDGTTTYTYDKRGELTGADHTAAGLGDEAYAYDAGGNRVSSGTGPSGQSDQIGPGNELASDGTFNYTYDAEGNLTRRTTIADGSTRDFVWDYRNRLVSVIDKTAGGTQTQRVDFTYDAGDRRISKTVQAAGGTTETFFVSDGDNVVLEFRDSDGPGGANPPVLSARNLFGPAVDEVLAQDDGLGHVLWSLDDHLGSVRDLIDSSGTVVNHLTYDSFGKLLAQSDPSRSIGYGFTGRELDAETGLQYNRARYYDANTGRFLSEDPSRFTTGTLNLYAYVGNDPVDLIDPFGLDKCDDLLKQLGLTPDQAKKLADLANQYLNLEQLRAQRKALQFDPDASVGSDAQGRLKVIHGRQAGFTPLPAPGPPGTNTVRRNYYNQLTQQINTLRDALTNKALASGLADKALQLLQNKSPDELAKLAADLADCLKKKKACKK